MDKFTQKSQEALAIKILEGNLGETVSVDVENGGLKIV